MSSRWCLASKGGLGGRVGIHLEGDVSDLSDENSSGLSVEWVRDYGLELGTVELPISLSSFENRFPSLCNWLPIPRLPQPPYHNVWELLQREM